MDFKTKHDADSTGKESVRDMVESIYRNYGVEPENMDDNEIGRVVKHYKSGKANIEEDYKRSLEHRDSFGEDGLI